MPARAPKQVHPRWASAMNSGDLEAALACYAPDASMVARPGQVVTGTEGIRAVIRGMLSLNPRITLGASRVITTGDHALVIAPWSLSGARPDGSPVQVSGTATDVVRRDPDGAWRFIIDNPFGTP